jgi:hypothetical protein
VIGSIALGVGASATSVAFIEGGLGTPFPYPQPETIVRINFRPEGEAEAAAASLAEISSRAGMPESATVSPIGRVRMVVPGELGADRLRGEAIGRNYFDLLQPEMIVGAFRRASRTRRDRVPASSRVQWSSSVTRCGLSGSTVTLPCSTARSS